MDNNTNNQINAVNQRSVEAMKASEHDELHIKPAVGKSYSNGKTMLFFVCGSVRGYVSERAAEKLHAGATSKDFQVADVQTNDGSYITCLMPAGLADVFTL